MKEIGWDVLDWVELAQDRGKCQALVYTVMNFRVIHNMRNSWLNGKMLAFQRLVCSYELVVWSMGRSVGLLVGCFVCWLFGCLVGWLVGQSVGWLVRYLVSLFLLICLVS
jgi:hypothetical protein